MIQKTINDNINDITHDTIYFKTIVTIIINRNLYLYDDKSLSKLN